VSMRAKKENGQRVIIGGKTQVAYLSVAFFNPLSRREKIRRLVRKFQSSLIMRGRGGVYHPQAIRTGDRASSCGAVEADKQIFGGAIERKKNEPRRKKKDDWCEDKHQITCHRVV